MSFFRNGNPVISWRMSGFLLVLHNILGRGGICLTRCYKVGSVVVVVVGGGVKNYP